MMLNKISNYITTILGSVGIYISVQDIEETLNIALLVISILNLVAIAIEKTIRMLKDKKITTEELDDLHNTLVQIEEKVENATKKDDN